MDAQYHCMKKKIMHTENVLLIEKKRLSRDIHVTFKVYFFAFILYKSSFLYAKKKLVHTYCMSKKF